MNTIWHRVSNKIEGELAQHLYIEFEGLLNVISLGIIKNKDVELRMAFWQTIPNVSMFYLIVEECSDFKLKEHWFGGEGMYVKPKVPTQIVFSWTRLPTVVSSNKAELNSNVVKVESADGLITLTVLI